MSIRAWIHDFRKLDDAILAEAAAKRRESDPVATKGAALAESLELARHAKQSPWFT